MDEFRDGFVQSDDECNRRALESGFENLIRPSSRRKKEGKAKMSRRGGRRPASDGQESQN